MSVTVIPNRGIMFSDELDRLRVAAVMEHQQNTLPEAVVYYIRALEDLYLDRLHRDHKQSAAEVGFVFPKEPS